MAFNGHLEFDDKQYRLLKWNLRINQQTDRSGRPVSNPEGGRITALVESTSEIDFFEWIASPDMVKSGKISFQRRDNTSSLKTFEFKDAYCIDYSEDFDSEGTSPMKIKVTLSAKKIKCGNCSLTKNWNKKS